MRVFGGKGKARDYYGITIYHSVSVIMTGIISKLA